MNTKNLSGMIIAILFLAGGAQAQEFDEFETSTLDPAWSWVREQASMWVLEDDYLVITTQRGALNGFDFNNVNNILLQDAPDEDIIRMETKLVFEPEYWYHNAGLIYYIDDDNYIRVSRGIYPNINGVWMEWEFEGETQFHFVKDIPADTMWLRLSRTDDSIFCASYSLYEHEWYEIGTENIIFPVAGAMAGLQAANGEGIMAQGDEIEARFDYFGMKPTAVPQLAAHPENLAIVSLHPNPLSTAERAVATIRLDHSEHVTWYFSDILGRQRSAPVSAGRLSPGMHTLTISLRAMPVGVYFLHVTGEKTRATQRILLTR